MDLGARTFDSLRRCRRTVGRAVWVFFALASAASGAAPCAAMAAPGAPSAQHAAAASVHDEHAHARAAAEGHAAAQGHFVGHNHASSHAHANEHASAPPADGHAYQHASPAGEDDAHEPGNACPHCPLATMAADAASSSHAHCFAADDASDGAKPPVHSPPAKTVASLPVVELLPVDDGPRFIHGLPRPPDDGIASVPLNLRYCVFLI